MQKEKVKIVKDSFSAKAYKFIKKQCIISFFSVLLLIVGSLVWFDSKINPIVLELPEAPELVGALSGNNRLRNADVLHFRKLKGCESLVKVNGYIYGSSHDGRIVKFNDTHVETFVKLGPKNCNTVQQCGRALGIRYDEKNNRLLYVDAYHGLFSVDINTGDVLKLFPTSTDSFTVTLFNDFDILPNGDVVVSESSTKYHLHELMSLIYEGRPHGRLIRINPSTGEHSIILDNLYFPNGVQVYKKNPDILLVVETLKVRILSINLASDSMAAERIKIFADRLPGFPDNIRSSPGKGGYWVNFATTRHSKNAFYIDIAAKYPFLRNSLKKFFSDPILHMLSSTNYGIIVRYDEFGNIVESLHDSDGYNITSTSETLEDGQNLYLGNYFLPYLHKLVL